MQLSLFLSLLMQCLRYSESRCNMITFMYGICAVLTSDIFLHFYGIAAVVASGLLIDQATHYRKGE